MFAGEGEPFLYKDMKSLSCSAKEAGIDLAFTSNGVLLTEDVARSVLPITSWIKISLNAGTPETYAAIHRTKASDFHKVIRNLKRAVEIRNSGGYSCTLGAQILLLPENSCEIEVLAKICREDIGLDYLVIKPYSQHRLSRTKKYETLDYEAIIASAQQAEMLNTDRFKVIYRAQTTENHQKTRRNFSECAAVPFFWAYVMANHDVYACSAFLKDQRFFLGNLQESSFQEIWEGDRRMKLFGQMTNGFDLSQCRLNCRMGFVNEYLGQLHHPAPHVNFI
jgi:GTP 3',8-cyclase